MTTYINSFTRIQVEGIDLKRMQVGNIKYYKSSDFTNKLEPLIDVEISNINKQKDIFKNFDFMFKQNKEGYFIYRDDIYYRNFNIVSNTSKSEIYYCGKFPKSRLYIKITQNARIKMQVLVSKTFLYESRSRLTKIGSFEDIINDILLFLSIHIGKIPMHCSAVQHSINGKVNNYIFMGLPNTGKTTTATKIASSRNNKLISEDIAFIDPENMVLYSCPYTSDLDTPQLVEACPVDRIYLLVFKKDENKLEVIDKLTATRMIANMNLYEFNWDKNTVLKGLMISGYMNNFSMNQYDINRLYTEGYEKLVSKADCYLLSGNLREGWPGIATSLK